MTDAPHLPDNPFWGFSLEVYGRAGVATACLALQDRHGLDVNLLLFCAWAGSRGRQLDGDVLARLAAAAQPWQQEVVMPLRALRRALKTREGLAPNLAAALRDKILAAELQAEAAEQQLLYESLRPLPDAAAVVDEGGARVAAHNLLAYLALSGVTAGADDTADLTVLLAGALPDLMPLQAVWLLTARS